MKSEILNTITSSISVECRSKLEEIADTVFLVNIGIEFITSANFDINCNQYM